MTSLISKSRASLVTCWVPDSFGKCEEFQWHHSSVRQFSLDSEAQAHMLSKVTIWCRNSSPLSSYSSRLRMEIPCVCVLFLCSCKEVRDIKWCKILYPNDVFNDMTNNGISYPNFHNQLALVQHLSTSSSEFPNCSYLSGTVDHLADCLYTAASLS